jgi:hypothetical protein
MTREENPMVDIRVDLTHDNRVVAIANPARANRGEEVTWDCQGRAANRGLRVVFVNLSPLQGVQPNGNQITGTVRSNADDGIHIYNIFQGDTQLDWANPVSGNENFGGLEIPRPPGQP